MAGIIAKRFEWLKGLHTLVTKTVENGDLQKQIDILNSNSRSKRDAAYSKLDKIYDDFARNYFSSTFSTLSDFFDGDTTEDKLFHRLCDDVHQAYARFLNYMKTFTEGIISLKPKDLPKAVKKLEYANGELKDYVAGDLMELIRMMYDRYGKEENLTLD